MSSYMASVVSNFEVNIKNGLFEVETPENDFIISLYLN